MSKEQTQLEYECAECAEYIMNRIQDMKSKNPDTTPEEFEENLSTWIHDHFSKEE